VQVVVMAAGEGSRVRPLTERYPKPVLPIDGRPVIVTLLHEVRSAGIERVTVVTGHLGEQVERLLEGFPLDLRFVRQPEPLGSADAVRRGLEGVPAVVVAADTVFTPGDIGRFAAVQGHAIAGRRDPPPRPPHRYALRVEEGRITKVLDDDPANPLAAAPLWRLGEDFDPAVLDGLDGPPFELARVFQGLIDAGETVQGAEIGPTRDLTHPLDCLEENFPYLKAL
jgi:UDP-N-acetylglucosamine diphosphorylase / glucose-1-phosphate thymidylyltransferase / UDP-N-acetylgalactosamine diphosphorylase / glucosamine-1-phosphate N-acetyltransferase / galactosamine-1-phosphate N-acetyltransferase